VLEGACWFERLRPNILPSSRHTKFSPDWCFGLLKQRFRRSDVNSLDELVAVVNSSASSNTAQLVGTQSGKVLVPTYDWNEFFSGHFRKILGITSYHRFHFSNDNPGKVVVKEYINSVEQTVNLMKSKAIWTPSSDELPLVVPPNGLSEERKLYLFEKIRNFCSPCQDLVCPNPNPESPPPAVTQPDESVHQSSVTPHPPGKQQRHCSKCHQLGHNVRSCKM